MATPVIQTSFHSGEWAPALAARVDLAKYHAGAALLRNFYVDYRGGASTRTGTKYILRCKDSSHNVRLIPFQASFTTSYVLEFGEEFYPLIDHPRVLPYVAQAVGMPFRLNQVATKNVWTAHRTTVKYRVHWFIF